MCAASQQLHARARDSLTELPALIVLAAPVASYAKK